MSSLTIRSKINVAVQKIQKCTMIKMINSLMKTIMPFYFSNYSNITLVVVVLTQIGYIFDYLHGLHFAACYCTYCGCN